MIFNHMRRNSQRYIILLYGFSSSAPHRTLYHYDAIVVQLLESHRLSCTLLLIDIYLYYTILYHMCVNTYFVSSVGDKIISILNVVRYYLKSYDL